MCLLTFLSYRLSPPARRSALLSWILDTCRQSLRSRKAMYGIGIPADIGIMYLTYHMKKKHSSLWYLPSALVTGANLYVAMHAYHRANQ